MAADATPTGPPSASERTKAGAAPAPVVVDHAAIEDPVPIQLRVLALVGPATALALAYVAVRMTQGAVRADEMVAAAAASVLGFGTAVIFGAAVLGETAFVHLTTLDLALVVGVFNTALAVMLAGAFDVLEKIPRLGPRLHAYRLRAMGVENERPWIRRWATTGVALFVISPLPFSGVIGGTLVGRVAGLSRTRTFVAVAVANAIVCSIYALGADALEVFMRKSRMTLPQRIGAFVAALALVTLLVKWLLSRGGNGDVSPRAGVATSGPADARGADGGLDHQARRPADPD